MSEVLGSGAGSGAAGSGAAALRGRGPGDPAWLEALLGQPGVHLIVDGYNVTKTAYGELTLEAQRTRLITGLRALAARSRAEVTCVFDGAAVPGPVPASSSRGVRVHFSQPGRTADEVIASFVAAEPPGRPLVVVSSDREVADAATRAHAAAVPSSALVALLGRA
jgi:predicted RNA-binding protein with PIN domain